MPSSWRARLPLPNIVFAITSSPSLTRKETSSLARKTCPLRLRPLIPCRRSFCHLTHFNDFSTRLRAPSVFFGKVPSNKTGYRAFARHFSSGGKADTLVILQSLHAQQE